MRQFLLLSLLVSIGFAHPARADSARLITQSTSSDCGPAALATLLTYYLDIPATEAEMMKLAHANPETGTSLKGLEEAAALKNCGADSFRMTFDLLKKQLESYPAPVIVRTLQPEPHFSLVLAVRGDEIALADPAVGNIWLSRRAFLRRWLVPGANDGYVFIAAREDGSTNRQNQAATLQDLVTARRVLQTMRAPLAPLLR